MAMDWRTLMLVVPWNDVIKNAPKVAEGARKLWGSITGKPQDVHPDEAAAPASAVTSPGASPELQAISKLEARLASTEAMVTELHGQMVASARLITDLAEQNSLLVKKVDVQQRQVRWLAGIAAVLAVLSITSLCLAYFGW